MVFEFHQMLIRMELMPLWIRLFRCYRSEGFSTKNMKAKLCADTLEFRISMELIQGFKLKIITNETYII